MNTYTWTLEIDSPVGASKLFKAAVVEWHNLALKLKPDGIVRAAAVQGGGGVGSVREFNLTYAMPYNYMKERLDFVDNDKLECKQTLIEGCGLGTRIESASTDIKFEPRSNGGCVCKVVSTYEAIPGVTTEEEITKAKEITAGIISAAEAYLLDNPGTYL
ncbi:pathogenesis-related protein 1-like [Typha latifolia]|uniref:pathogenesis-related protein 1-like n=1 Tax=Typha latifolia TaxID=4733 RepID=UPI003C2DA3AF